MGFLSVDKRAIILVVAVLLTYLATALVIVGLCTNSWLELRQRNLYDEDTEVRFGLHRVCWVKSHRCINAGNDYDQQNTLPAVQGLLITGGFLSVFATLLILATLYLDRLGKSKGFLSAVAAALCVIPGVLVLVSIILFAIKVEVRSEYLATGRKDYFGFSFGLSICAGILLLIAAPLNVWAGLLSATPKFANQVHQDEYPKYALN